MTAYNVQCRVTVTAPGYDETSKTTNIVRVIPSKKPNTGILANVVVPSEDLHINTPVDLAVTDNHPDSKR